MNDSIFSKALAEADSKTQASFLNDFYAHLKACCKGKHDQQLCYLADSLDSNGREFCQELASYARLAVESRAKIETDISDLYKQRSELEEQIAALRSTLSPE